MAEFPRRYSICFADPDPAAGAEVQKARPGMVVSQNGMNRLLGTVVICPLTTSPHPGWRSRIRIQCAGEQADIAVDGIRTVSRQRHGNGFDRPAPTVAARPRRLITEMYGR